MRKRNTSESASPQSIRPVQQKKNFKVEAPLRQEGLPKRINIPEESKTESTSQVVFDAFTGTDNLVLSARLARLDMRCKRRKLRDAQVSPSPENRTGGIAFLSQNGEARETDSAINNLTREDFGEMEVLGKFNLGFILLRCRNNHLWIDQHACDEKYNLERLCTSTIIQEHHCHCGAPDGQKSVEFGKDDISAMCAMLSASGDASGGYNREGSGTGADGSGRYSNNAVQRYAGVASIMNNAGSNEGNGNADRVIARLPKAIAMLASRACRGSIMIGTALSNRETEKIVRKLQNVKHPWNCPHGRPTLRHVCDLQPVLVEDERRAAEYIAGPTVTILSQRKNQYWWILFTI